MLVNYQRESKLEIVHSVKDYTVPKRLCLQNRFKAISSDSLVHLRIGIKISFLFVCKFFPLKVSSSYKSVGYLFARSFVEDLKVYL